MSAGIINIQGFGNIAVPGSDENQRMRYAQNLINNRGVFIPPVGKCTVSVITWQNIPHGTPVIAIGTLSNYICLTLDDLKQVSAGDLKDYKYELASLISLFSGDTYELINKINSL